MANTKGQQSTVFKPLRCRYFNVASLSWYDRFHVRGCWFTAKQNKKKATGHCGVKRGGEEEKECSVAAW